jgi:hypothetical protein
LAWLDREFKKRHFLYPYSNSKMRNEKLILIIGFI